MGSKAVYIRLDEIVHVPSVVGGTLKRCLKKNENRRDYVQHIFETAESADGV